MPGFGIRVGALLLGTALIASASSAVAQDWQSVAPMPTGRSYHASAIVANRWYVAGGEDYDGTAETFPSEVDVYDPTSGQWAVVGQLAQPREDLVAIADSSHGSVVFTGGVVPGGSAGFTAFPTCDVATSEGVQSAPNLLEARYLHAATFSAGRLIVSGGWTPTALLESAEVWDGVAADWTSVGVMPGGPRAGHTMTTLQNGRQVLVAGGGTSAQALNVVNLFDASCRTWSTVAPLKVARARHKAVLLSDGRVLVAGGYTYPGGDDVQIPCELFDPESGDWGPAASMMDPRFDFDMVLLPDGRVLAAGGSNDPVDGEYGALGSAEVYDPVTDTWSTLPPMHDRRRWPTLAVLSDGVYVAGGSNSDTTVPGSGTVLASVERLAWSDLGIAGPIELNAGVPGEYVTDASTSCGSDDAGAARDAGPDRAKTRDSAVDVSQPDDAELDGAVPRDSAVDVSQPDDAEADATVRDAGSSDRGSAGTKSGCSCDLNPGASNSYFDLAFALALGVLLRRRSPRA